MEDGQGKPGDPESTRVDRGSTAGAPQPSGRYEVVRILGRGAMGTVYLAEDRVIGRRVALKEIRAEGLLDDISHAEQRARFEVEFRSAGKLSHPHIATLYDAFESDGSFWIALEYVPGTSLADRLNALPPLTPQEALRIAGQIASGLDHAHRHGVVHRDVKPANILLSEDGFAKVTDFGIAKLASVDLTQTGVSLGTPAFMSPEQIKDGRVDGRSDQFSLAVILYRMLTGRRPFDAGSEAALLHRILNEDPERPSAANPSLPPSIDRVVLRGLAKDPAARFPSCSALVDELAAAFVATEVAGKVKRLLPALSWGIAALVLAVLLGGGWFLWNQSMQNETRQRSTRAPQVSPPEETRAPAVPSPEVLTSAPEIPITTEPMTTEPIPPVPAAPSNDVEFISERGPCQLSIDGLYKGFTPLTVPLEVGRTYEIACVWPDLGRRSFRETLTGERKRFRIQP